MRGSVMLAADLVDHLSARVHEFHRAISDIPFNLLGAIPGLNLGCTPVRLVHDGITDSVYKLLRRGARGLFSVGGTTLRRLEAIESLELRPESALTRSSATSTRPRLDLASSILSGFVGDRMARRRNPLRVRYGVYQHGQRLRLTRDGLADAFPQATPRIAVFLHGLCGSETVWKLFRDPANADTDGYGVRLARDLGYTPVFIRYNSGLHVSLNGRHCSRTLTALYQNWPMQAEEIVLIGHSMGGLLARSAAEIAASRGANWLSVLRQIICLGTPHLGAPLEQFVHLASQGMHRLPLLAPLARLLDARSLGIKDLRWGYTRDREWKQRDPDELWTDDRLQYAPLPGVHYRFLGTCLASDPQHLLARLLGDGLVRVPSSLASDVAGADTVLRSALHHMQLLNHPDVYARISDWLSLASEPSFNADTVTT